MTTITLEIIPKQLAATILKIAFMAKVTISPKMDIHSKEPHVAQGR